MVGAIEHRGAVVKARAFPKDSRVRQGDVIENKLLGAHAAGNRTRSAEG
jgi:hypothetical protein